MKRGAAMGPLMVDEQSTRRRQREMMTTKRRTMITLQTTTPQCDKRETRLDGNFGEELKGAEICGQESTHGERHSCELLGPSSHTIAVSLQPSTFNLPSNTTIISNKRQSKASPSRIEAALANRSVTFTVTEALVSSGRQLGVGTEPSPSPKRWSLSGSDLLCSRPLPQ
ncbi:uncharacterized protein DS421_10g291430 [Arachis hypogaea]|nr:uncharacterized protein DS421_10g291430 [Arachis hypogaea]